MNLNREELAYGALFQCLFAYYIGLNVLWALPLSAFLWAFSGSGHRYNYKLWRRLGCPIISCLGAYIATGWAYVFLSLPFSFGALCLGYGTPSAQPPDEGSMLGRFYYDVTGGNEFLINILTRGTIIGLAALPIHIAMFLQ